MDIQQFIAKRRSDVIFENQLQVKQQQLSDAEKVKIECFVLFLSWNLIPRLTSITTTLTIKEFVEVDQRSCSKAFEVERHVHMKQNCPTKVENAVIGCKRKGTYQSGEQDWKCDLSQVMKLIDIGIPLGRIIFFQRCMLSVTPLLCHCQRLSCILSQTRQPLNIVGCILL